MKLLFLLISFCCFTECSWGQSWLSRYDLKNSNLPKLPCYSTSCFQDLISKINEEKVTPRLEPRNKIIFGSGHQIFSVGKSTDVAVLFIHGLYGSAGQFADQARDWARLYGMNTISVSLPGHGHDMANHNSIQFEDWRSFAREAYQIASTLGKKVVIVGQSTGGLIATDIAISNPENLQALVLIDPAFRVTSLRANLLCGLKNQFKAAQEIPNLAGLLGFDVRTISQPISLNMGCEVVHYSEKLFGVDGHVEKNILHTKFQTIKVPSFIAFTSNDAVVDPSLIESLKELRSDKIYFYDINKEFLAGFDTKAEAGPTINNDFGEEWADSEGKKISSSDIEESMAPRQHGMAEFWTFQRHAFFLLLKGNETYGADVKKMTPLMEFFSRHISSEQQLTKRFDQYLENRNYQDFKDQAQSALKMLAAEKTNLSENPADFFDSLKLSDIGFWNDYKIDERALIFFKMAGVSREQGELAFRTFSELAESLKALSSAQILLAELILHQIQISKESKKQITLETNINCEKFFDCSEVRKKLSLNTFGDLLTRFNRTNTLFRMSAAKKLADKSEILRALSKVELPTTIPE